MEDGMSEDMQHTCEFCGKTESGPDAYWPNTSVHRYETLPAGWYQGKYDGADGWTDTQPVCSLDCAKALEVRRDAETEARNAEYRRRKEAGELTPAEIWGERLMEQWMNDYAAHAKDYEGLSGKTTYEMASEPVQWETTGAIPFREIFEAGTKKP